MVYKSVVKINRNERLQNVVISVIMNNEQFFFYLAFENSECIRCFSILTEGLFKKIYMNPGNDNEITLQIA